MDTMDLIRGTTAESLENVRSDFDDLPTPIYRGTRPKSMTRIVDATADERSAAAKARAANRGPARRRPPVTITEARDIPQSTPVDASGDNPFPASAAQLDHITRTLGWLAEVDPTGAADMTAWLDRGGRDKLTGGRGGSASDLIGRIKARIEAKKAEARTVAATTPLPVVEGALPVKTDKSGKPMPLYYAVGTDADVKFYRIKPGRKPGFYFVDVQASDDFHSIRNVTTKAAIVQAIIDAGAEDAMARYGQLIGRCGRCGRTLTDPDSRTRGIGPDCLGRM